MDTVVESLIPTAAKALEESWTTKVERIWIDKSDSTTPVHLKVRNYTYHYRSLEDLAHTLLQVARGRYQGEVLRQLEDEIMPWLSTEEQELIDRERHPKEQKLAH